jgi:CubicO group peptidase (beta-lactamase class C family)
MRSSLVLSSVVLAGLLAGARFAYSGAGINLLQFVLERGLGLDVHAELRRRVFQHFDMRHTSMTWQPDSADNLADGYTSKGESRPHPRRTRTVAASSMDTTIEDFARFLAGLSRGDGLSTASRAAMTAPQGSITTATESRPSRRSCLQRASGRILPLASAWLYPMARKDLASSRAGTRTSRALPGFVFSDRFGAVVLLSNDVRAERAFASIVASIFGETGTPWR